MSKKQNKREQQTFMQISNPKTGDTHLLEFPLGLKPAFENVVNNQNSESWRDAQEILQLFCERFMLLNEKGKKDFEIILNSGVSETKTFADLLVLLFERDHFYILKDIDSKEKLGRFHITMSQTQGLNNWESKQSLSNAKEVGEKIKALESGKFWKNDYVGLCRQFINRTDD